MFVSIIKKKKTSSEQSKNLETDFSSPFIIFLNYKLVLKAIKRWKQLVSN